MNDRIYTKEEVVQLLERTADLQRQSRPGHKDRHGLTLAELEAVAADAGLDADFMRQAAAELDQPHRSLFETSSGTTPTHVFAERWVPGVFTAELWEDIVAELRYRFDSTTGMSMGMPHLGLSTTESIGRTAEWRHANAWGVETRIMMRQSGDRVRVRLSRKVGWASSFVEGLVLGFIPAAIAGFVAGIATESALWGIMILLLVMAVCVPGFAWIDKAWREKKDRELEEIGDHIAHMIASRDDSDADRTPFGEAMPSARTGTAFVSPAETDGRGRSETEQNDRIPLGDDEFAVDPDVDADARTRNRTR